MGKLEFLRLVRSEMDKDSTLNAVQVAFIFDYFIESISNSMLNGDTVYLRGFGRFRPLPRRSILKKRYILRSVFKPYPDLDDKVNKKQDLYEVYLEE
jgi:nucleoid DNA-binding protein